MNINNSGIKLIPSSTGYVVKKDSIDINKNSMFVTGMNRERINISHADLVKASQGECSLKITKDAQLSYSQKGFAEQILRCVGVMCVQPNNNADFKKSFDHNVTRLLAAYDFHNLADYGFKANFSINNDFSDDKFAFEIEYISRDKKEKVFSTKIDFSDFINKARFEHFILDSNVNAEMKKVVRDMAIAKPELYYNSSVSHYVSILTNGKENSTFKSGSERFLSTRGSDDIFKRKILLNANEVIKFVKSAVSFLSNSIEQHSLFKEEYNLLDFDKDFVSVLLEQSIFNFINSQPNSNQTILHNKYSPLPAIQENHLEDAMTVLGTSILYKSHTGKINSQFNIPSRSEIKSKFNINPYTLKTMSNIGSPTLLEQYNVTSPALILNLKGKADLSLLEEENENSSDDETGDEHLTTNAFDNLFILENNKTANMTELNMQLNKNEKIFGDKPVKTIIKPSQDMPLVKGDDIIVE